MPWTKKITSPVVVYIVLNQAFKNQFNQYQDGQKLLIYKVLFYYENPKTEHKINYFWNVTVLEKKGKLG